MSPRSRRGSLRGSQAVHRRAIMPEQCMKFGYKMEAEG